MRAAGIICLFVLAISAGCERELPYEVPVEQPIAGYQIEGYVTDRLGVPLKGVRIGIWYDYEYVDNIPPPAPSFVVDDSTKRVQIRVFDHKRRLIATLYDRRAPLGTLNIEWNKRYDSGVSVGSGVYTVDFSINGVSRSSYTVIVDGAVTALTDSLGHYVILDENLPVGFSPVPRYISSEQRFLGNYRITPTIALDLYFDVRRGASISLTKNKITRRDFIF